MNRLFLFDVDSTLINQEVIDLLAAHAGVEPKVREITDRAMAGEIDFQESLKERVALLKGLPANILDQVRSEITLTSGARELIAELQSSNDVVAVVSGGFTRVIEPLMNELNIEHYLANELEIIEDQLTGKVVGQIVDRKAKADFLERLRLNLDSSRTIATGDGANDIDMVSQADLGIAFCAKPALQAVAQVVIEKRDLREILKHL
jgi:phosphoserine phosphatase